MPPKRKITKEEICAAALDLVRAEGEGALNARSLADRLGCSTQPVFSQYKNMEELRLDVMAAAYALFRNKVEDVKKEGKYSSNKCEGMGYIRFAVSEKNLFRMLFLRDRRGEKDSGFDERVLQFVMEILHCEKETAIRFQAEVWFFTHGIATLLATDFLQLKEEEFSQMLTESFNALVEHYQKEQKNECH